MGKSIAKRRTEILNLLNKYGSLDLEQLRAAFPGVSDVTLRKDLQYLDDSQQAIRTHGGAKSMPSALNFYYRSSVNLEKKRLIAAAAAKLIKPGDSVFISAGTTCAELARCLPSFPLRVCSDGVYTVSNIPNMQDVSVELLGGEVDLNIMRVEGLPVLQSLEKKHFSISFIGALSMNADYGLGHSSVMTSAVLEKVIERSDKTVVIADSSKITNSFPRHSISLSAVDIIVSDSDLSAEAVDKFKSHGVETILTT